MGLAHPILGTHGQHAVFGQMRSVWIELTGTATDPAASEEEHDRRPAIRDPVPFRLEDMHLQLHVADRLIDLLARRLGRLLGPTHARRRQTDCQQQRTGRTFFSF